MAGHSKHTDYIIDYWTILYGPYNMGPILHSIRNGLSLTVYNLDYKLKTISHIKILHNFFLIKSHLTGPKNILQTFLIFKLILCDSTTVLQRIFTAKHFIF